jgi:Flp pilus assembly protein TadG
MMKNGQEFSQLFFDETGTAAIEFGLVGSFLSLLFIGLVDFGMGYWEQMQVGNAVRAGAEYVIANSGSLTTNWNQSAIQNAVTSATSLSSITATPAPTQSCGCPTATGGITTVSGTPPTCGASCTGGGTAGAYTTINAQAIQPS